MKLRLCMYKLYKKQELPWNESYYDWQWLIAGLFAVLHIL